MYVKNCHEVYKKTLVIDGKVKAVNLRLLVDLHRRIAKKTETGGKSMNLVVVELLERGFGEMGR